MNLCTEASVKEKKTNVPVFVIWICSRIEAAVKENDSASVSGRENQRGSQENRVLLSREKVGWQGKREKSRYGE